MTTKQRKAFESTVRRGHPSDVRHYEAIVDQVLANCPPEEIEDANPLEASTSNLGYAIWRLKTQRHHPRCKPREVDYFIRMHNMTSHEFADAAEIPYGAITKIRAGYRTSGPDVEKAHEYIRMVGE